MNLPLSLRRPCFLIASMIAASLGSLATAAHAGGLGITPSTLPTMVLHAEYTIIFQASGGTDPLTWTILNGSIPSGLNLDPNNGYLYGNPDAAGTFNFTIKVTDGNSVTATKDFTLLVLVPPKIDTQSLPAGHVGVAYNQTITASAGSGPYAWTITAGSPPAGINFTYGTFSGTPTQQGTATCTIQVTDTNNITATQSYLIGINGNQNYLWSTLAGQTGVTGSADGTGADATFGGLAGMALAPNGDIYLADPQNQTIRKITPDGVVTTFAGKAEESGTADGTGSDARFKNPAAVAVDAAGNVFVADTLSHSIRKITPNGVVTTFAGKAGVHGTADGPATTARFYQPRGLVFDTDGILYVADTINHSIRKIAPDGTVSTLATNTGANEDLLGEPVGIAVDRAKNVLVANPSNNLIVKITPAGVATPFAGANAESGTADGIGVAARFRFPSSLTIDAEGNLYVTDEFNTTIRRITPAGTATTLGGLPISGHLDGLGYEARLFSPGAIAVDANGTLYVTDWTTVRKGTPPPSIAPATLPGATVTAPYNQVLSSIGGTASFAWELASGNLPAGVNFDSDGHFSGTATTPGTANFSIVVTDANGQIGTRTYALVTSPVPSISTASPLTGSTVGATYSQLLAASDGTGPFTWIISDGNLPPGVSLDDDSGLLSGKPTASGSYSFTVQITDANGVTVAQAFDLAVAAKPGSAGIPTIAIKGKKKVFTTRPAARVKGSTTGTVTTVLYRVGKRGAYKVATGTGAWKFKAKVLPGKNVISVYAVGPGGSSATATATINRLK